QAQYEARHALFLANEVKESRKEGVESFILAGELPLQQIAGLADLTVSFDEGYQPATRSILEYIRELQQQQRTNEQELYDRARQIAALEAQLDSLETRLGGISEQRQALEVELERQAKERAQFARIENMFNEDDADVLRDGSDIIIRMVGTSFPVGKATIEPHAYGLLTTLMEAIRVFPDAMVTIEGHTDAYGGDAINMKLSQERADAVRAYLRANMNIADAQIAAVGYGETRPIANNETKEGRARNRRIDIVLHTKARSGS
ncbi:MAG: OmpA family protein, partial [Gammaproteobacteria bacterium]|nr:OmpA family protein [Gammaproteobacteria bacterium]